jgi:hypothetical protein
MFVKAIKDSAGFTKQLRTIHRTYGSKEVIKSASTLMTINKDGWLLTSKHVAQNFNLANVLNQRYEEYKKDRDINHMSDADLKAKYQFQKGMPVQLKNQFFGVFQGVPKSIRVVFHKTLDLALVHVEGDDIKMLSTEYPLFSETEVEAGMMLCKLGYPFAEYTCVAYEELTDDINFTQEGQLNSPYFPLEGMVTRKIGDGNSIVGFEMSTPGIKGQSGGPVFDEQGVVYGVQTGTRSHDLDIKMTKTIRLKEGLVEQDEYAFLNVGIVISSKEVIAFLNENNVKYRSI